jgi:hypothetical protein
MTNGIKPDQLTKRGRQVLTMKYGNVTLKDTRLYLSGGLSSLPKNFDFEDKISKGVFPHVLSNSVDVFNYEAESWPDIK